MKLPKSFLPEKSLDHKVKQLIKGYENHAEKNEAYHKAMDVLDKLNLDKGVLYVGLRPVEFERSNLPYEKVAYLGIACSKPDEKFYRYRFNYKSTGFGLRWLEITDTRLKNEGEFKQLINEVMGYYNLAVNFSKKPNCYKFRLHKPQTKKSLMGAIDKFYCAKFPYLGTRYDLFLTKVIYKGITEEEFLSSNLPLKYVNIKWKGHKKS